MTRWLRSSLGIVGQQRKAVQYVIGNPLFAVEMTRHAIGAALYVPLRVLIYEADDGKTCIEYDRASSLFGQFGDERVGRSRLPERPPEPRPLGCCYHGLRLFLPHSGDRLCPFSLP